MPAGTSHAPLLAIVPLLRVSLTSAAARQEAYAGLARHDRLVKFLGATHRSGGELPGHPGGGINFGHILRLTGTGQRDRGGLSAGQRRMIAQSGMPVAAGTYVGAIGGQVAGQPWREQPVTVPELPTLLRMVYVRSRIHHHLLPVGDEAGGGPQLAARMPRRR